MGRGIEDFVPVERNIALIVLLGSRVFDGPVA
jgi:hypothetical protein